MTQFFLASNPENLERKLESFETTITVEAEYGDRVVKGTDGTWAHHGSRAGAPCPCMMPCVDFPPAAVGLSHLDLDALGGCLAALGYKPPAPEFWALAAHVDVNGPHKLAQFGASEKTLEQLHAYWAWAEGHKVFAPRDGSVLDVTEKVQEARYALEYILAGDPGLLEAGRSWKQEKDSLNEKSFLDCSDNGVILREGDGFLNHLYETPDGRVGKAVVALRTDFKSCTVSLADPIPGVSCVKIVQSVWPDVDADGKFLAGGHAGIAGSPRGRECNSKDLGKLYVATIRAIG